MWDDLPPEADAFVARLIAAGFAESRREPGTMDSGLIELQRRPLTIWLVKDRSQWSMEMRADGWQHGVPFPLLAGCGDGESDAAALAPRADRDRARHYDVPEPVRWLLRVLVSDGFAETGEDEPLDGIEFRRDDVVVRIAREPSGWAVHLDVDGWGRPLAFPRFEGFGGG